jgi:hypothetical protein
MSAASSENAPRRRGAELLEQELDRLRRAASGRGLIGAGLLVQARAAAPEPEEATAPVKAVGRAGPTLESWLAIAVALLFGSLLIRLVAWLFDFPTDTLDLRSSSPISAHGYHMLLLCLAVAISLVVLADVAAMVRAALRGPITAARPLLGCCGLLAAALLAQPWEAAVWLADGPLQRHTVREAAAALLVGAAGFWLYPRASRLSHTLIAAIAVWELVEPYRLGWVEEPTIGWLGADPVLGTAVLRYAVVAPMCSSVLAAGVLLAGGQDGRRHGRKALGTLAICLGALLVLPWPQLIWLDPAPQQHQLIGWTLAGAMLVVQGVFLLAPARPARTDTDGRPHTRGWRQP